MYPSVRQETAVHSALAVRKPATPSPLSEREAGGALLVWGLAVGRRLTCEKVVRGAGEGQQQLGSGQLLHKERGGSPKGCLHIRGIDVPGAEVRRQSVAEDAASHGSAGGGGAQAGRLPQHGVAHQAPQHRLRRGCHILKGPCESHGRGCELGKGGGGGGRGGGGRGWGGGRGRGEGGGEGGGRGEGGGKEAGAGEGRRCL